MKFDLFSLGLFKKKKLFLKKSLYFKNLIEMMKKILFHILFILPLLVCSQSITNITPSQGAQGQTIPLIISGQNIDFSGWSCWSNTGNLSDFRFSQWSGTNMMYGNSTNSTANMLEGNLNIPAFQPLGIYNTEVYDCSGSGWIMFPNSFMVNPPIPITWDCIGGACVDPGTGQGTFTSLSACQTNCVVTPTWDCLGGACVDPGNGAGTYASLVGCQANCILSTWDCIGGACIDPGTGQGTYASLSACQTNCNVAPTFDCIGGACVDPGTGQGTYASLTACQTNCVLETWECIGGSCIDPGTGLGTYASLTACQTNCTSSSVEIIDVSNFKIYPNPTSKIVNINFTSKANQDIEIKILSEIGMKVYSDNKDSFIGKYTNQINLNNYRKGIYFIEIKTNQGVINRKLILQ